MTGLRLARILSVAATMALVLSGQVNAEGSLLAGGLPVDQLKRLVEQRAQLEKLDKSDAARSLYSRMMIWPPGYGKLRVCFLSGPAKTNAAVARVAQEWITGDVGLKLDFGKPGKPRVCSPSDKRENQIRVSYNAPGFWSHTGQNAVVFASQQEASLNLDGFDKIEAAKLGQGNERSTILHVFGHALGLLDEHLQANGRCQSEFDWNYLDALATEFNGFPTFIMPQPLIVMLSGPDIVASEFDPKSIMLEPFPEKFFRKGAASPCFIKQYNADISTGDHAAVAAIYPAKGPGRQEAFEQKKEAFEKIAQKAGKPEDKKAASDVIKAFFSDNGATK